jgi:putative nucleotidyltransferase with HDIG domain
MLYPFRGISKRFVELSGVAGPLAWGVFLWVAAVAVAGVLIQDGADLPAWWILLALVVVAGVSERQSVRLFSQGHTSTEVSGAFLPFVFTAVAFGPFAALLVGAAAHLADLRRPYLRWFVYTPIRALTGVLTGLAVVTVSGSGFGSILVASLVGVATNLVADGLFNVATGLVRRTTKPLAYLRTVGPFFLVALGLYAPIIAALVYGYQRYSLVAVVTFLLPAVALQKVIHLYQEQRDAAHGLAEANRHLERANVSFAAALVATLDARDRYTAGHSAAVAIYSRDIAERMGLSPADQQTAHLAGLVHDIGKVGLPTGLLEKEGPLTLDERRVMQSHSEIGERILANVDDYGSIAEVVRHHHERVDGEGYPDGRRTSEIPIIARIIAVADAYNAMTSDRPYREAMPSRVARMRLAQAVGSQFDTSVVAAFEAILATATEEYRLGLSSDFAFATQDGLEREPSIAVVA